MITDVDSDVAEGLAVSAPLVNINCVKLPFNFKLAFEVVPTDKICVHLEYKFGKLLFVILCG